MVTDLEVRPEFKNLIPPLSTDERMGLERSIVSDGCRDALVVWGRVLVDGHNRYEICRKNGVPFRTVPVEFGSEAEARVWIRNNQMGRRNLTDGWKAELALGNKADLLEMGRERMSEARKKQPEGLSRNDKPFEPHRTREAIAETLGWSTGKVAQAEVVKAKAPEVWEKVKAGEATIHQAYQEVKNEAKPHVAFNSGENEWYTPERLTDMARMAMGSIDTDPASTEVANRFVKAEAFYTAEDDGLKQRWRGNVWMNPPYSQPLIAQFAEAVVTKYLDGEIRQAIVLVNNATDTKWFQGMLKECSAVCFIEGRVKFIDRGGNPSGAPLQGQALLYFGERIEAFRMAYSGEGTVLVR
jgi:ParB family chromosome partitioning protein